MTRASALPWARFVALGDSLTEGVGDPRNGQLRGWADRVADALKSFDPNVSYVNLARRSLLTRQVREEQLERALELRPDLVSVVSGMNDILGTFDKEVFASDLDAIVGPVAATGAAVMMGTFPP